MNAPLMPNTSAFNAPSLPMPWINRIFQKLHGRFGNGFTDKYRVGQTGENGEDVGILNAKAIWAEELAGHSPEEIAAALAARYNYPPSLDEFQKAARPPVDLHAMLLIAAREMGHRRNHQPQAWPSNRVFWAAQRIGDALRTTEKVEQLLKRFELAWFDAAADANKPIPDVAPENALPAPGKTFLSKEEAKQRADHIGLQTKSVKKIGIERQWAHDIAAAPEKYPAPSIEAALKALQVFGVEWSAALVERARQLGLTNLVGEPA